MKKISKSELVGHLSGKVACDAEVADSFLAVDYYFSIKTHNSAYLVANLLKNCIG